MTPHQKREAEKRRSLPGRLTGTRHVKPAPPPPPEPDRLSPRRFSFQEE